MIDTLEALGILCIGVPSSGNRNFILEYKEILIAITPIIAAFIAAFFSFRQSIRRIKNHQEAQSNLFHHELDKLKMSILGDNYKKLYRAKLECAEALQILAFKVILVDDNSDNDSKHELRQDIERSTYTFYRSYLNLYIKYSIIFGDEIYLKMTSLKEQMENIIEDMDNKQGIGFLSKSEGERIRKFTLDLIALIRNDLLLDNNLLKTINEKTI